MEFKINDYVYIKNTKDIYVITKINNDIYTLKGIVIRTFIEVNVDDIEPANINDVNDVYNNTRNTLSRFKASSKKRVNNKILYGKILHIDGDEEYLNSCMELYKDMNLFVNGICIKEEDIKNKIEKLILDLTPDIVVITGHDYYNKQGIKDLSNYKNTAHFIDALRIIRKHFNEESMIVIIGACASHFEALIASGANFSSSPKRINIHTYDPAILAIKAATTSNNQNIDFYQALKYIEDGHDAFGGIETKGKMKILL